MASIKVVIRAWRDGSLHAEIPFATLIGEDDLARTHSTFTGSRRFETLCGVQWFGRLSASGYCEPKRIDCDLCRVALEGRHGLVSIQTKDAA